MWFLIIRSTNEELRDYTLKPGRNTLGREADNDISIFDDAASRYHAEVIYDESSETITIHDLRSTNGTFVNSKRVNNHTLQHEDQIRIGFYLLTLLGSERLSKFDPFAPREKNVVTKELVAESIDQYGVLLHDVGRRLVNIPNLDTALSEIAGLIKKMIGADGCKIILAEEFGQLRERGIPIPFAHEVIEQFSASIFSPRANDPLQAGTMLLAPVMIDDKVAALIFAHKDNPAAKPFFQTDMQLVLAIGNQVALSIQRQRVQAELLHNSLHDTLTGLPNRVMFLDRLRQAIARYKRNHEALFAVLFFDIDNFKIINDSLGHGFGDQLLLEMADRLKNNIREIDTVTRTPLLSRFGGDEFSILLDDIKDSQSAIRAAVRIQQLLIEPFKIAKKEIFISVSIGVALGSPEHEKPEDVLRDADIAMYRAKELGKERIEIYDTAMHSQILESMRLVTALRKGAIEKEFRLHYQPISSLAEDRIVGFEALLRWYTPDRGILAPDQFINLLDTGDFLFITDFWVLKTACAQIVAWQNQFKSDPPLFMTVNISSNNIKHPNFLTSIQKILKDSSLESNRLWLEVSEKVSVANDEKALEVFKVLHDSGVHICLDDFGTGYSSLSYLVRFPINCLKIDQSFIRMLGVSDEGFRIVETIKALAAHLGLVVVAEGVENPKQLSYLKTLKCEYAQGYLMGRPLDAEEAGKLLEKDILR